MHLSKPMGKLKNECFAIGNLKIFILIKVYLAQLTPYLDFCGSLYQFLVGVDLSSIDGFSVGLNQFTIGPVYQRPRSLFDLHLESRLNIRTIVSDVAKEGSLPSAFQEICATHPHPKLTGKQQQNTGRKSRK